MPTSDTSPEKDEQKVDDGLKPKSVVEKIAEASAGEEDSQEHKIGAAMFQDAGFQDKGAEQKEDLVEENLLTMNDIAGEEGGSKDENV